jgi:hypothetical protein
MAGAKTPAGIPEPREGIQTLVFTKRAGHWLIAGFQNTHSVPERPFPTGPSAPTGTKPQSLRDRATGVTRHTTTKDRRDDEKDRAAGGTSGSLQG